MIEYRDNRDIAGQSGTFPGQCCRDGRDTPLGGVPVVPLARSAADLVPMPQLLGGGGRGSEVSSYTHCGVVGMKRATLVKRFCKSRTVPTGRLAGKAIKLAPYQDRFIDGAFTDGINVGVLSVGRGHGKSALSAILCAGELLGAWSDAAEREIIIAARMQEQARIAWNYTASFGGQATTEAGGDFPNILTGATRCRRDLPRQQFGPRLRRIDRLTSFRTGFPLRAGQERGLER